LQRRAAAYRLVSRECPLVDASKLAACRGIDIAASQEAIGRSDGYAVRFGTG